MFNQFLRKDGFELAERTRISGRPVYVGRFIGVGQTPGLAAARETLAGTDPGYVSQQITRMESAVSNDPGLAIGTAKELVESCCKTILTARAVEFSKSADIPELVKLTSSSRSDHRNFLMRAAGRDFTLADVASMSEDDCFWHFTEARFGNRETFSCTECGTIDKHYFRANRRKWRCRHCEHEFSCTTGTALQDRKITFKNGTDSCSMNNARIRASTPRDASFSLQAASVFSDREIDVPSSFSSSDPQDPSAHLTPSQGTAPECRQRRGG